MAMGLLEAVVVLYLRRLLGVGFGNVLAAPSGPLWASIQGIELTRELATLVMILAVAWLGAAGWRGRLGAFAFVFGLWDLSYYLFLAVFASWPSSPLDWDLLFLIPAPWWGPVLAPALIAVVLVVAGVRLMWVASRRLRWFDALAALTGGVLLVGTFLLTTPPHFAWVAYVPSLLLFAVGFLRW